MTERQLLELLLQKVTNIETEQQAMKADQHTIKTDVSNLKDGQLCLETRLETEVIDKVRALFDAREVQNDINERIISTIDRIEAKVEVVYRGQFGEDMPWINIGLVAHGLLKNLTFLKNTLMPIQLHLRTKNLTNYISTPLLGMER